MDVYSHASASLQTEAVERMQAAFENIREKSGRMSVAKAHPAPKGDVVKR